MKRIYVLRFVSLIMSVAIIFCIASLDSFATQTDDTPSVSWNDKIDSTLLEKMETATDDIPVWIWFSDIDDNIIESEVYNRVGLTEESLSVISEPIPDELSVRLGDYDTADDKSKEEIEEQFQSYMDRTAVERTIEREQTDMYISALREVQDDIYPEHNDKIIKKLGVKDSQMILNDNQGPFCIARLTPQEIIDIAKKQDTVYLDYYTGDNEVEYEDDTALMDCSDTFGAADGNIIHNEIGLTGDGVVVGIIEQKIACPNYDIDSDKIIYLAESDVPSDRYNVSTNSHATRVARIIVSDTGVAPNAKIAYATQGKNKYNDSDLDSDTSTSYPEFVSAAKRQYSAYGTNDAVTSPIAVVNYSMGDGNWYGDPYTDKEKFIDFLAYRKKLLFITPVGNGHNLIGSPSLSYNSISPGGFFNSGSQNAGRTSTDTDVMYWGSCYYDANSHSECCYKPDFVSPQISFFQESLTDHGTSFAAPFVTGTIALLYELRPSLKAQPDVVKAILMASCHRKVAPSNGDPVESMEQGITAHQGAGALNPYRAIAIAASGNYGVRTISGTSSYETINFVQPPYNSSSINFSIAWLRNNPSESTAANMPDLDLELYRNNTLLGSSEHDISSTEMVYSTVSAGDSQNYKAEVYKYSTSNEAVKFAYAFSVSNIHFQNVTRESQTGTGTYYNDFITEGLYFLKNKQTGMYLSYGGSNLVMSSFSGEHPQMWLIKDSRVKTDCLTHGMLNAASNYSGNFRYALATNGSGVNVRFSAVTTPNGNYNDLTGIYKILNNNTGEALSYSNSRAAWFTSNMSVSQQWYLERAAFEKGDVDMDGEITLDDAAVVQQAVTGAITLNDIKYYLADFNGDGKVTLKDASRIQIMSTEIPNSN